MKRPHSMAAAVSNANSKCQKCLQPGHWTADCINPPVYKSRPSRTKLLKIKLSSNNTSSDSSNKIHEEENLGLKVEMERRKVIEQILNSDEQALYNKHAVEGEEGEKEKGQGLLFEENETTESKKEIANKKVRAEELKCVEICSSDTDFSSNEEF